MPAEYKRGSELPRVDGLWLDSDEEVRDLSSGWTFTVRVGIADYAALVEKTDGITGAATDPNVIIEWEPGELDDLAPGNYDLDITATLTETGQSMTLSDVLTILPAVLPMED